MKDCGIKFHGQKKINFMNSIQLRKCLSLFATGITSIVTKNKSKFIGITVNSFSSVSLNPPLVMWCIDKKSSSIKDFVKNKNKYMIIFLSRKQKKISNQLASSNNRFDKKFYKEIISNSLGYLDCAMYKKISAGDHYIILHKVIKCKILSPKLPLIYYNRKYNS